MVAMKSYTDLEQSRKLAEILPLESADMYWYLATKGNPKAMFNEEYNEYGDFELPCWSLAALLGVLPKADLRSFNGQWICFSTSNQTYSSIVNNPVDACYEMILKLHELNLI